MAAILRNKPICLETKAIRRLKYLLAGYNEFMSFETTCLFGFTEKALNLSVPRDTFPKTVVTTTVWKREISNPAVCSLLLLPVVWLYAKVSNAWGLTQKCIS